MSSAQEPDFALIQAVARDVHLEDVFLVGSTLRRDLGVTERVPKKGHVSVDYETSVSRDGGEHSLTVTVSFTVTAEGFVGDSEGVPVAEIHADFAVLYRLREGSEHTDAAVREFANVNAVFNAWPYLREFAQNMSTRARIPPVPVPLFRVSAQSKERQQDSQ